MMPKTGEVKEIERKLKKAMCAKCWSTEVGYDFRTKEWNCNGCGFKWLEVK